MPTSYTPNNTKNVSTTRGVTGGYIFRAATTVTDVPTNATWTPTNEGWKCLGYIPEDGLTESVSQDSSTSLRDINLDLLDEVSGSYTETLNFALMEVKADALAVYYGSQNVTDVTGLITVDHNWSKAEETMQYALLLLLKDDRKMVKYIPQGKVSERGDVTLNKTTAHQHEVTLTYTNDNTGSGCKDFIESTETS